MGYALRAGLSFCIAGGRAIFLDLGRDRYFCLGQALDAEFRALVAAPQAEVPPSRVSRSLLDAGVIKAAEDGVLPQAFLLPCPPGQSVSDAAAPSATTRHVASAAAHLAWAAAVLRRRRLDRLPRLLASAARAPATAGTQDAGPLPAVAVAIASAHRRLALMTTAHETCLWRSIALARHLAGHGIVADLVFGVQARPFKAHCWLQRGPVVVNDRVETVCDFTPILVL